MPDDPTPAPAAAPVSPPADPPRPKRSPLDTIGIDAGQTGEYEYVFGTRGERVIHRDGITYEHCADDPDGCWLYRAVSY